VARVPRIVERRPARHAGERGGLGEREVRGRLVEVEAARRLDAAQAGAERDPVQVLLEDLALRERRLDAERERHLGELAGGGARPRRHGARELLRQRRPAGDHPAVRGELPERAEHGQGVHAGVAREAPVLGGEQRALDAIAERVERHPAGAGAVARAELAEHDAVAIADHRRHVAAGGLAELRRQRRERGGDREQEPGGDEQRGRPAEGAQQRPEDAPRGARPDRPGERGERGAPASGGRAQAHRGGRAGAAPAGAAARASTWMRSAPERPKTSGVYISSARVGGSTNAPSVVARAR
jgi:hypothetical protein